MAQNLKNSGCPARAATMFRDRRFGGASPHIAIRFSPEVYATIVNMAREENVSFAAFVRKLVDEGLGT